MAKIITSKEAAALIKSGDSVMFGGFMGCGTAQNVVNELAKLGTDNLTAMCNDGAKTLPDGTFYGISELIHNKQVKRVIATEGQTVVINFDDGEVWVDGELLEEDYVALLNRNGQEIGEWNEYGTREYHVPEGCYFVMGDNRDNSLDSRDWGFVPRGYIHGKAWRLYWSWDSTTNTPRWGRIGSLVE